MAAAESGSHVRVGTTRAMSERRLTEAESEYAEAGACSATSSALPDAQPILGAVLFQAGISFSRVHQERMWL